MFPASARSRIARRLPSRKGSDPTTVSPVFGSSSSPTSARLARVRFPAAHRSSRGSWAFTRKEHGCSDASPVIRFSTDEKPLRRRFWPVRARYRCSPSRSVPSPLAETISVVRFIRDGTAATVETTARNVAGFLAEQGITLAPEDYVSLDPTAPIVDGATLEYRAAIPVTLVVGNDKETFRTSAVNVAALLSSKDIALGPLDRITPPLSAALEPDSVVRIQRVRVWTESIRKPIPAKTVRRLDPALAPNQQRVLREGIPGIRETTFRVTEIDGVTRRSVIRERTLRKPQPRIVGTGFGLYGRLGALALRAAEITSKMTKTALRMIATGYSAACPGCSGYTALGARAGYGIVAVDP